MKILKPLLFVIMICSILFSLTACIIIPLTKHYDIPAEDVASVEFYDLSSLEDHYSGFDTLLDPVYTLPQAEIEAFLSDFSELEFTDTIIIMLAAIDPSFWYGDWVVRVNFENGQYTFYSSGGYGETFDADGNCISSTHFSCDDEALANLISKYYSEST